MGFYNIVLEGEQAEAYKAKKAKEAEEKEKAERERLDHRYKGLDRSYGCNRTVGSQATENHYNRNKSYEDQRRHGHSYYMANKYAYDNSGFMGIYDQDEYNKTFDAVNKHMRRHPDLYPDRLKVSKESNIFESVEFLND